MGWSSETLPSRKDEWFHCAAGEYVVEIGNQRFEFGPGDSVLGPRRVPHAFAFVGNTAGNLLIGFTPAGRM
jgi:mannose-6-phosphate isomerase-like protein (cupin superfamily)